MQYVHFPKSGSTFALAVWASSCDLVPPTHLLDYLSVRPSAQAGRTTGMQHTPQVFRGWLRSVDDAHGGAARACPRLRQDGRPLNKAAEIDMQYHHHGVRSDAAASTAVAMFRAPFDRALSHWRYVPGNRRGRCPTRDELYLLRDASIHGGIVGCLAGCQCKMLLGRNCLACRNRTTHKQNAKLMRTDLRAAGAALQPPLSDAEITECVRRVSLFRFAGLTDRWNDSIARFCEQTTCPPWVLDPARRVTRRNGATQTCNPPAGWLDAADTAVYDAARAHFERSLRGRRRAAVGTSSD